MERSHSLNDIEYSVEERKENDIATTQLWERYRAAEIRRRKFIKERIHMSSLQIISPKKTDDEQVLNPKKVVVYIRVGTKSLD